MIKKYNIANGKHNFWDIPNWPLIIGKSKFAYDEIRKVPLKKKCHGY